LCKRRDGESTGPRDPLRVCDPQCGPTLSPRTGAFPNPPVTNLWLLNDERWRIHMYMAAVAQPADVGIRTTVSHEAELCMFYPVQESCRRRSAPEEQAAPPRVHPAFGASSVSDSFPLGRNFPPMSQTQKTQAVTTIYQASAPQSAKTSSQTDWASMTPPFLGRTRRAEATCARTAAERRPSGGTKHITPRRQRSRYRPYQQSTVANLDWPAMTRTQGARRMCFGLRSV
jgi:hypothetical protein